MQMRLALILAAASMLAAPSMAGAERFELGVGTAMTWGTMGTLDVGEQTGVASDGESDLIGRNLALVVSAGVAHRASTLEVVGGIAIGGLDLAGIEKEYCGEEGQLGGASVVFAALRYDYTHRGASAWQPLGGVALGIERMSASSGIGGAQVDAIFAEPHLGISYDLSPETPGGARWDLALALRLARVVRARISDRTDGFVSPESPAMLAMPSLGLQYRYTF